jgi:4-amino-4-deoxy-L-arabinose transferase-like glycosyltransferase
MAFFASRTGEPTPAAPHALLRQRAGRRPWRTLGIPLLLGLALRLWFVYRDPAITGDAQIYAAIAHNLLAHGVYGYHAGIHGGIAPTLIRLPGYPLFLAACFWLLGGVHLYPVLFLQIAVNLAGCVLLAGLAYRLWSCRAALWALWLAALCPFTASYTAAALTETLELFCTTVALYCLARGLQLDATDTARGLRPGWLAGCAAAWIGAVMLRPDGALLGLILCPAIALYSRRRSFARRGLRIAYLTALASLLAFLPWTLRNWHTFHVFEPLAPRYATDPGEPINPGFQQWTKSICADLACTSEVYWQANDGPIDPATLPSRAFDSSAQHAETAALLAQYNRGTTITPELDQRFAALAHERIHDHPLRYYVGLPLLRLVDMWLRPRVEFFNIDLRWWNYAAEGPDTILAYALGAINLGYLVLAAWGALRNPPLVWAVVAFTILRCALLLTIEAPETRYTLEWYPMLILFAAIALAGRASAKTA